ncbi:hypothetical protein [Neobacillus niacini]|jgi:hypothetical protein|uniref:hypothetical protein n=1 Tax=Neobacillus niacini TaxID=86668 RepID=UPI001C8DFFD2|nr:hypothetical protein [Neobacillus niacini]MBY0148597.1 hypothetical protein [Neobacillus niacini]
MKFQLPDFSRLNAVFQEATENMEAIQEQLKQATEPMVKFAEAMRVQVHALNLERIAEGIKATSNDVEKFKLIMAEMGYPPHEDLEIIQMREIVHCYYQNGLDLTRVHVEKILIQKFNEETIKVILRKWIRLDWLHNRLPILNEGIEAHNNRKFFSSIATLLPQIEGIIVENFNHTGWLKQDKLKSYIESLLNEKGTFSFDNAVQLFFFNVVLSSFQHGQVLESPLSRHAILHGADTNYGTELNSLRCIILLDYLIEKFDELKNMRVLVE